MTHQEESTRFAELVQLLNEEGFDGMAQAMQLLLNEAMKIERAEALGAQPYERSAERRGYANGFKPKTVKTRGGELQLQQNAQSYVPRHTLKAEVAIDLRNVFNAADRQEAERMLAKAADKHRDDAPQLADWIESSVPEGLAVFQLPATHRKRLRTTNVMERLNKEIARRTRVATLFPNEESLLRLASAVLVETDEEWQAGNRYLNMEANS